MLDLSNDNYVEFGNRLTKARESKGKRFTQENAAESIGVARETYSTWENGSRFPHIKRLAKICEVLETDLGYLLGLYDEKNNDIHKIIELTGLSEKAVENLISLNGLSHIISFLLENDNFHKALKTLASIPLQMFIKSEEIEKNPNNSLDIHKQTAIINAEKFNVQQYVANAIDDLISERETHFRFPESFKQNNIDLNTTTALSHYF